MLYRSRCVGIIARSLRIVAETRYALEEAEQSSEKAGAASRKKSVYPQGCRGEKRDACLS